MTDMTNAQAETGANKFYFAAWRWHFYAGLFVLPFFIILAVSGMMTLWIAWIDGRDGERTAVIPQEIVQPVSAQALAAMEAVPGGTLRQYVAPRDPALAALFRVDTADDAVMVAVDPYTAQVIETFPRRSGWYDFFDGLHGDLTLGTAGDRILETAASLGLVLVATGLYMWWARAGARRCCQRCRAGAGAGCGSRCMVWSASGCRCFWSPS